MPNYTFDVELVLRLHGFEVEASTEAEAEREAKAACRDFGNVVDYSITPATEGGY